MCSSVNQVIVIMEKIIQDCISNLKKNGFDSHFFQDTNEAKKFILDMILPYKSFGIGGSNTIRSLNIVEELKKQGKIIHDHWQNGLSKEQDLKIRLDQGRCDCFLCSANAISASGEIVNIDGVGNRVTAMTFGPKKVVIVAGINKITPDLDSAVKRAKQIAGPLRAKSLKVNTPCVKTGKCTDCDFPQRICRITTILHKEPMLTSITVILINKELGY